MHAKGLKQACKEPQKCSTFLRLLSTQGMEWKVLPTISVGLCRPMWAERGEEIAESEMFSGTGEAGLLKGFRHFLCTFLT